MQEKYDAVLYIDSSINENDERLYNKGKVLGSPQAFKGNMANYNDDPKLYSLFSFGNDIRRAFSSEPGYYCQVTDFKKWVVVTVSYSDTITGKLSSKTFLIVFNPDKDGIILSTHNRYRSISGVGQAITYIKSACQSLKSDTQNRIG